MHIDDLQTFQEHVFFLAVATNSSVDAFIMATLRNRAGHYIFALWFLSSFFVSFFFFLA